MNPISESNSASGFTLLESIVAVAIMAVGMLGVASLLNTSMSSDRFTQHAGNSRTSSMEIVEQIKGEVADITALEIKAIQAANNNKGTKHNIYYKWEVSDLVDSSSSSGITGLGILQLTINMGWDKCSSDDPATCNRKMKFVTFVLPKQS